MVFFFFFSSRRRHTRSLCDWSSDVCSSDLACSVSVTIYQLVKNSVKNWVLCYVDANRHCILFGCLQSQWSIDRGCMTTCSSACNWVSSFNDQLNAKKIILVRFPIPVFSSRFWKESDREYHLPDLTILGLKTRQLFEFTDFGGNFLQFKVGIVSPLKQIDNSNQAKSCK